MTPRGGCRRLPAMLCRSLLLLTLSLTLRPPHLSSLSLKPVAALSTMASSSARLKSQAILHTLNRLYPDPPVPLNSVNEFTFLVAVVLSAQTTDGKVNEVTKELFQRAREPAAMCALSVEAVQAIIRPVGLAPTKAKNIVALSRRLVDAFGSEVPKTYEELESLPGVGHKTASVVMSTIFGQPNIAVDTHIHRLALRWNLTKHATDATKVQKDLCAVFPIESWNKLHLQLIYFGREYCTAKDHTSSECPICSFVNNPSKLAAYASTCDSSEASPFTPKKKSKGIVFYGDRTEELSHSPSLTFAKSPSSFDAPPATDGSSSAKMAIEEEGYAKAKRATKAKAAPTAATEVETETSAVAIKVKAKTSAAAIKVKAETSAAAIKVKAETSAAAIKVKAETSPAAPVARKRAKRG